MTTCDQNLAINAAPPSQPVAALCERVRDEINALGTAVSVTNRPVTPCGQRIPTFTVNGEKPEGEGVAGAAESPELAVLFLIDGFKFMYPTRGRIYWRTYPIIAQGAEGWTARMRVAMVSEAAEQESAA